MPSLLDIFRAGFVHRWHTNPDLAHTNDRIDGHSARVARIILALHPDPSFALIREALTHDDGESVVGDVKAPTKDKFPVIRDALEELEHIAIKDLWGDIVFRLDLSKEEELWLKLADRLDAYMWASHHAPYVLCDDGWPEAREWLCAKAVELDCVTAEFRVALDMALRNRIPLTEPEF